MLVGGRRLEGDEGLWRSRELFLVMLLMMTLEEEEGERRE